VTLYYLEDRSVQDVAVALDLNVTTVKTHLSRARAALREAWLRRRRTHELPRFRSLARCRRHAG
jgi:DNA-directed RNA polymerase specialized sigma24 family protein